MKKHISRRVITLALALILLVGIALPAGAASGVMKELKAYVGGITIYLDGKLNVPVNANGDVVEPMIVDGTTYLPVRAISNMLGEEVAWDSATRSIYIGEPPAKGSVGVQIQDIEQYGSEQIIGVGENAKYYSLGEIHTPFNSIIRSYTYNKPKYDVVWKLDSEYKSIDGMFDVAYTDLDDGQKLAKVEFYSVDRYGAETLIASFTTTYGDDPLEFSVDVTACDFVRMKTDTFTTSHYGHIVLYNITATTIG